MASLNPKKTLFPARHFDRNPDLSACGGFIGTQLVHEGKSIIKKIP
jgi:hypothetical protein